MWGWLWRVLFGRAPTAPAEQAYPAPLRVDDRPLVPPAPLLASALPSPAWLARMPAKVLFVDVETTGLTATDRIVSIAGIILTTADLADGHISLQFGHYIVDPGRNSHPRAEGVHGYSDWLLRHQSPFGEIADAVVELITEANLVVAHNAEFDVRFINAELAAAGRPTITKPIYCTMEDFRALNPGFLAALDHVAAWMGISRAGPRHGALEDAWLAMMIYLWLHGCPYRMAFSAFPNPLPSNIQPVPPMPGGSLPRRKRVLPLKFPSPS